MEPKIGMSFGSFCASTNELCNKYLSKDDFTKNYSHIYLYNDNKELVAISKKDTNPTTENVAVSIYDNLTNRTYTSSTELNRNAYINGDIKFDKIVGTSTYAVDLNGNGKVDEGEIFSIET